MPLSRRQWLAMMAGGLSSAVLPASLSAQPPATLPPTKLPPAKKAKDLTIKEVRVTPVALPDPPLLAASGCHGPYFLRSIVEIVTTDGVTGIGETNGSQRAVQELQRLAKSLVGRSALAYRSFTEPPISMSDRSYAAVEVACLDAIGKAAGLRLCELLGGPVREEPEFAAYLFFRYAADNPKLLADKRVVDSRGTGDQALDQWGEVRTPEAMAELAFQFHKKFGYRVHKLKAGVLKPEVELEALKAISSKLGQGHLVRIDPNARWSLATSLQIGRKLKELPLEYYEDPIAGQEPMAEVRRQTGLKMSTNMCVTAFSHIAPAIRTQPVDVVLADHHYWGGITGCQTLGRIAKPLGWVLSQHSNNHTGVSMAAMIHVAALIPELTVASDTHYPWLQDDADIINGPKLPLRDGRMSIPTAPGLGVTLDQDKLASAKEIYQKCGMRDRDDATTMQMVEPGWTRTIL